MVVYPDEWRKFMMDGKVRTFRIDTPKDIVNKAKVINDHLNEIGGKPFFHFENESN